MRVDDKLEQEAREVGAWLREHASEFAPLQIRRVDPSLDTGEDGEPFIRLTVVLEDPEDPEQGWPMDSTWHLRRAVRDVAAHLEHGLWTHVHLQSVSDEAA
jgi:hypothetical protein